MNKRVTAVVAVLVLLGGGAYVALKKRGQGDAGKGAGQPTPAAGDRAAATTKVVGPGSLAGRVDAGGQPVAGAVVRLVRAGGEDTAAAGGAAPLAVAAGADGRYALDVPAGAYTVTVAAAGFVPAVHEQVRVDGGQGATLDVTLVAGARRLSGKVSDASGGGGGGVAQALVEAIPEHGLLGRRAPLAMAAFTGADGAYVLSLGEGRYRVQVTHPDYVSRKEAVELGAADRTLDVALVPGGVIEGVVRATAGGAPVAGAQVSYEREAVGGLGLGEPMAIGRGRGRVTADAEGRFRVSGLEAGAIRLEAQAAGLAAPEPTVVPLGVAEAVSGVEIFVGPALSIAGVVELEGGGGGVAGVSVEAFGPAGRARAESGADGHFVLDGLLPGAYRLMALGDEILPSPPGAPVVVKDKPVSGVTLSVRAGLKISGQVEPAGVAEVSVARDPVGDLNLGGGGGMVMLGADASTLASPGGRFVLGPVAPGEVILEARAADGRRGRAKVQVGPKGAEGVVITLAEGGVIAGTVSKRGGGVPEGAAVSARRVQEDRRVTMIVNGRDVSAERAAVGADGSFVLRGLGAGRWELSVLDARGQIMRAAEPADKASPEAPVAVVLKENERREGVALKVDVPDGVVRGVVVDDAGKPVADAWVSLARAEGPLLGGGPGGPGGPGRPGGPHGGGKAGDKPDGDDGPREVRAMVMVTEDDDGGGGDGIGGLGGSFVPVLTDAEGRFAFSGLDDGRYRVLAEAPKATARGRLEDVKPANADVRVVVHALTRLEGKVTRDGKPVSEFLVELSGPVRRSQRFKADDGRYAFARVDVGAYEVKVTAAGATGRAAAQVVAGQPSTADVTLIGGGAVIGKIVDAAGAPLAGAPVLLAPLLPGGQVMITMDGEPVTTKADGSFKLDAEPGKHLLVVLGATGPAVRRPVEVGAGQTVDLGTVKADGPGGGGPGGGSPGAGGPGAGGGGPGPGQGRRGAP